MLVPRTPLIAAVVVAATPLEVIVNVALEDPRGTLTEVGIVMAAGDVVESFTATAPLTLDGVAFSPSVPVDLSPPSTVVGDAERLVS